MWYQILANNTAMGKVRKIKGFPQYNYYLTNKNIYVIQGQWLYE